MSDDADMMTATLCPYCHPHCVRTEHGSDCVLCDCRRTRPIVARKVRVVLGERYMLRQGRAVPGHRRVVSGEIVRVVGLDGRGYVVESHDGITVTGVQPMEIGRYRG